MRTASPHTLAWARQIARHLNSAEAQGGDPYAGRRVDADETNMLALALEHMRAKVYEEELPPLKARMVLPVAGDVDPGAQTFAYEETSYVGDISVISDDMLADDPSMVETGSTKVTHSVVTLGGGFIHSIMDLKRAAFSGRPLPARKASALRKVFERGQDRIAALGAPDDGIAYGLLNRVVGTSAGQIRGTSLTTAAWDATPDAAGMIADANKMVAEFIADSEETIEPNLLVLPTRQYLRFAHTYTTDGNPESALERFVKSNGFVREVMPWNLLRDVVTVDGTNDSRALLMCRDSDVAELVVPEEFTVLAPQPQNFAFKTLAYGRTAGCCIYRPLGLRYGYGLSND